MTLISNSPRKRKLCTVLVVAILFATIVATVVPLVVIIPKNEEHHRKSAILRPLYIYPENDSTWMPLYNAIEHRPHLKFIVVVNPNSGPGSTDYPNEQYSTALEKLNLYQNVQTIGYVRTNYASRNITTVLAEVSTYAGWASKTSSLAMHGIFLDEAPHQYALEAVEYMRIVNQAVKDIDGLQGDRIVVRNPGVIPDACYDDSNTDITVVFEQSYSIYMGLIDSLVALPDDRSRYCYMINSVPATVGQDMRKFLKEISEWAEYLFVTDNTKDFYESFGPGWEGFVKAISA